MLTIENIDKLYGHGFISNGVEWRITHIKECVEPAAYHITIQTEHTGYLKFELFRTITENEKWYGIVTADINNNNIDWNILFSDNIKKRESMLKQ
jgi:hypothetical protein